jgi:hypothetical protein
MRHTAPAIMHVNPDDVATQAARRRLLARCIRDSGMSQSEFAVSVLVRDARTVRRWLSSERPVPALVAYYLAALASFDGGIRHALRRGARVMVRF